MYMLKHCRECFTQYKARVRGRDASKAQGKAECFISIKATRQVLYFA